jgi:uncharacterized Fe-S cluster-containing protein
LIERGQEFAAVEIKSGATINEDFFKNLKKFSERIKDRQRTKLQKYVVYCGQMSQKRSQAHVLSWKDIIETLPGD